MWVRMDCGWPQNPKFLDLVDDRHWRAITAYWAGLGWTAMHGHDGFIPRSALPLSHGTSKEAGQLVDVGLWLPGQGGWDVNDYKEYQRSNAEQEERSQRARK